MNPICLLFCFTLVMFQGCQLSDHHPIPEVNTIVDHDVAYIPYESSQDDALYKMCDSTEIYSGRNLVRYEGGPSALTQDLKSKIDPQSTTQDFNGYIMVRFLINCQSEVGRFRARALHLDFTPDDSPQQLTELVLQSAKSLPNWVKSTDYPTEREYSKFINLKFENGKIQHVIL